MKPIRPRCLALAFVALLPLTASAQSLTAADIILRLQQHYSVAPPPNTVDTIKAGDPSTPVKGIAVTFLDTMDVLREADKRGLNLVITHEPTFYNHLDETAFFVEDPVYLEKLAFIQQHHMVVFRFHDQMHAISPDPVAIGLVEAIGWQSYMDAGNPFRLTIPQYHASSVLARTGEQIERPHGPSVGNPALPITHVGIFPGPRGHKSKFSRCVPRKSKCC